MMEKLSKGDKVIITLASREIEGLVILSSGNSKSLMLTFDAFFGGYVGMMPLLYDDTAQAYRDLIENRIIKVKKADGKQ